MSPKVIDKNLKKIEILEAAMKVFAQKGIANTKMADVAEAAMVGKGTIYEYFKSKEEIINEGYVYFMDKINTIMAKQLYKVFDPIEKLKAIMTGWVRLIEDTSIDFLGIMMDFWAEGIRRREEDSIFNLKQLYAENRQLIIEILEEGIAKGKIRAVDSTIAASIIIGALDGLFLQWLVDQDLFRFEESSEVFIKTFLQGLQIS